MERNPCTSDNLSEWAKYNCQLSNLTALLLILNITSPSNLVKAQRWKSQRNSLPEEICKTENCIKTAASILSNLDSDENPCRDFHRYACGRFGAKYLPEDEKVITPFALSRLEYEQEIQNVLKKAYAPNRGNEIQASLHRFFDACMNREKINILGNKPLLDLLKVLGKWPLLNNKGFQKFDWVERSHVARTQGTWWKMFFSVATTVTSNEPATITVAPYLTFPWDPVDAQFQPAIKEHLKHIGLFLGFKLEKIEADLADVIAFLESLWNNYSCNFKVGKQTEPISLKELDEMFPKISWKFYIDRLYYPYDIKEKEIIFIHVCLKPYLQHLFERLEVTSNRTVASYMMWNIIWEHYENLSENFQMTNSTVRSSLVDDKQRFAYCEDLTAAMLPFHLSAAYTKHFIDKETRTKLQNVSQALVSGFMQNLHAASWLAKNIRTKVINQLTSIKVLVAYPQDDQEEKDLEKQYRTVFLDSEAHFQNVLNIRSFETKLNFLLLRSENLRKLEEKRAYIRTVQIQYNRQYNMIVAPLFSYKQSMFNKDRPPAANYGAIGVALATTLTNALENLARKMMAPHSTYDDLEECNAIQNRNNLEEKLDGLIFPNINLDGIVLAYNTFQKEKAYSLRSSVIQGLPYTTNQLFWIMLANSHGCHVEQPLRNHTTEGIDKQRFNNIIFANPNFRRDFNCPLSLSMKIKRCSFWY